MNFKASLKIRWLLSLFSGLALTIGWGHAVFAQDVIGEHPGYIYDVEEERRLRVIEMVLIPKPEPESRTSLSELIFVDGLSREFQSKYDERFGRSDAERNIRAPSRFEEYEYSGDETVSVEEYQKRKQEFGRYMVRRLAEHHVDEFFKSNPSTRQVYELKERISNVDMEVKKGYKVRFRYSFSGNYLDMDVDNPYEIDSKLTLQMDPAAFGPSSVEDTIVYLGYPTDSLKLSSQYATRDGVVTLTGTRPLRPGLSASLTGSTYVHEHGESVRQHLLLVGLTWSQ